jgi:glycosyltransferase involved in cell wall biosynthesis
MDAGHQVHLVSTFPYDPLLGLASFHILPVAFGTLAGAQAGLTRKPAHRPGRLARLRGPLRTLRYFLGPLSLPPHQRHFLDLLNEIQPGLVHALRIPFEGMLAVVTPPHIPLLVSIWGNDLTLHARGSFMMAAQTRRVLRRANGLLADTRRDIRLASEWGLASSTPTLIVPGGGGIRPDEIERESRSVALLCLLPDGPLVVNSRGQRPGSLRQDVFFQAIPLVLQEIPQAQFVCPSLAGDAESERWIERLRIQPNTHLWPRLERAQLWTLFRQAQVFVSPSIHDGIPNSLLEAMACGCFPVVGDIESLREWVHPGVNGLLVDARSPRALADGILAALQSPTLRVTAKNENARLIAERADYGHCMATAEAFYERVLSDSGQSIERANPSPGGNGSHR